MSAQFSELTGRLSTVIGITVTPYDAEDNIDLARYRSLVDRASSAGISALTPNGNTSEFYSLAPDERLACVRATIEVAPDSLIMPGVGLDVRTATEEARAFFEAGAECIMVHQPPHPFWSTRGWLEYHKRICQAVPEMGVTAYVRSPIVSSESITELAEQCPNFIGIKYAIPDPVSFGLTRRDVADQGRLAWICGVAEMWAPSFFAGGATGFTSGLVSIDPNRSLRLLDALRNGDKETVQREWLEISEFEELRAKASSQDNVSVVKEALSVAGLCLPTVRAPLSRLNEADRLRVKAIVEDWGL